MVYDELNLAEDDDHRFEDAMLEWEGQNLDRVWLEDSPYFKGYGWTRFHFMKLEPAGKKKEKVKQKQEKKKVNKNGASALVWGRRCCCV
jgi:hypothetical protein